jgi:HEAT repeat protein
MAAALGVLLAAAAHAPPEKPPAGKDVPAPAAELVADDAPDAVAVQRLVEALRAPDAVAREAAIRRLLPHPGLAAGPVAEAFAAGNLQSRLEALELLRAWHAPLAGLDPWRPETLTAPRLRDLRRWAADPGKGTAPVELSAEQRAEARGEITRMLRATDAEAAAVRERLARHGRPLLPEVAEQLRNATTDQARERLTALRYRLVCPGALALTWPGGLERLAATNAAVRHQAAQELAGRAGAAEEPLLLELFASPDPLVRETALRALQEVAGPRATAALTGLLHDPEPNVRAAVLKQLAEQPSPGMAKAVAEYVAGEKDPDLLVHAVRALREAKADVAVECLKGLLTHKSWRVRAEAAEGLVKIMGAGSNRETNADICVALLKLLEDPDGFVVSRAVPGLGRSDLPAAVEPLVRAARKDPELAVEVIRALSSSSSMRPKALPHLRAFCTHPDPDVRAAAVAAVSQDPSDPGAEQLRAALQDRSGKVRRAAAQALFRYLNILRSSQGTRGVPEDPDTWLEHFGAGKGRSEWLTALLPLVRPLLDAQDPEERLDGALVLLALAQDEQALPLLLAAAKAQPSLQAKAAEALPWVPWPQRLGLFNALLALRPAHDALAEILREMSAVRDARAIPRFWELAAGDQVTEDSAGPLLEGLLRMYFGDGLNSRANGVLQVAAADRKEAAAAARPRAEAGSVLQRLIALGVLATASPEDAVAAAGKLMTDPRVGADVHRDAFQALLLCQAAPERCRSAIDALAHPEPGVREVAVEVLARGTDSFGGLRGGRLSLYPLEVSGGEEGLRVNRSVVVPTAPRELRPEMVRPLLRDPNPRIAACAGYLLALLGEPEGLGPLLKQWRAQSRKDDEWTELVYRAVATLGDDSRVPILEEIYRAYLREQPYRLRDFYWTIRIMEGPNALRLRKQIRQDVGMDALR